MKPHKRVFVVGGAHTTFLGRGHPDYLSFKDRVPGERENPSLEDHLGDAVRSALETTGVDPAAIDKGYVSNFLGEAFCSQGHMGAMLAAVHPDLEGKPYARIEAALEPPFLRSDPLVRRGCPWASRIVLLKHWLSDRAAIFSFGAALWLLRTVRAEEHAARGSRLHDALRSSPHSFLLPGRRENVRDSRPARKLG